MKISDLVFVGIRGSVVALNRHTGEQVWATRLKGWDFVNVVLEGNRILASSYGEIFCLDALTGKGRWHNPLKGYGRGLAAIVTSENPASGNSAALAAKQREDEQAATSSSAVMT